MSRKLSHFIRIIPAGLALLICALPARAMDRWAALSQIESGDDDTAVGAAGEISRYQMKPELWQRYAAPDADWQVSADALVVAQKIMKARCMNFANKLGRQPTDFEFYVLWNAPGQISQPTRPVRERAERFSNLVNRPEQVEAMIGTPAQLDTATTAGLSGRRNAALGGRYIENRPSCRLKAAFRWWYQDAPS